jgi:GNAT superfamily N-acetyltransferase
VDEPQVTHALLHAVEQWARSRGATELIGPFGLSDKDPQGLQVEGFEHLPVIATATNPAYLPGHVEQAGYVQHTDCVVYRLPIPEQLPEVHERIARRAAGRSGLQTLRFSSRWQLRRWIIPVLRLVNEAYKDLLGFMPMREREMRALANAYLPLLDPRFTVIVVDHEQRPTAFVVAVPDMSEGIRKAGGRLLPFGWFHLLRAMRKSRQLDLLLGAVRPDLQGRGLTSILGTVLMREAHACGFTHIDSHLVLEDNHRMRAELERLGAVVYKRYRIFRRPL